MRKTGIIEFIAPVILDNGTRVALRVFKGENITKAARTLGAAQNLTDAQTEIVVNQLVDKYSRRMQKKVLTSFPVTVPDGRTLNIDIHGEEHDLAKHFGLAQAMRLDINIPQLVNLALTRLLPVVLQIPVGLKNASVFHFRQNQDPSQSALAFCEYYGHTKEVYDQIIQNVYSRFKRL